MKKICKNCDCKHCDYSDEFLRDFHNKQIKECPYFENEQEENEEQN